MKKLIGLGIGVAAIIGLVASGTWALFSDTETSEDNEICAGTIDISINPEDGQTAQTVEGVMDLKPCQTGYININVTNTGTNEADVWKHIVSVENDENGIVEPEQDYYDGNAASATWKISDWLHYDMSTAGPLVGGFLASATSVSTTSPGQDDGGVDITVEDMGGAVKWTFDFPVEGVQGAGHMAYALEISSPASNNPTFMVFSNDGTVQPPNTYPNGTHLYSEWDPALGGYNGWHTSDPAWVTPVSDIGGIAATGDRDIADNPNGIFTVTIDKCDLGACFKWGAYFGSGGFFNPYGGQSQYPNAANWPLFQGTNEATNFPQICQGPAIVLLEDGDGYYLTDTGTNPNSGQNMGVESKCMHLGVLQPGESMCIMQSYTLDCAVENWGQSDCATFDIEFIAQQTEGNPPPPTCPNGELPLPPGP